MKHIAVVVLLCLMGAGCGNIRTLETMSRMTHAMEPVVTVYGRPYVGKKEAGEAFIDSRGGMGTAEMAYGEVETWQEENPNAVILQRKKLENGNCSVLYWANP